MRPISILKIASRAGGSFDTQTVTVGSGGTASPTFDRQRGYNASALIGNGYIIGSISDGTSNIYSGASIIALCWSEGVGYQLAISGAQANSGWTSITIAGVVTLTRASATFAQSGGGSRTSWTWNQDTAATQAFGSSGTKVVGFS